MSIHLQESPIAHGRTADIFAWEDGQVLKLFHEWVTVEAAAREQAIARVVQQAGLPVAAVGELVEVAGRVGLLYERVAGPTMWDAMQARPWTLAGMARRLADLHVQVHAVQGVRLPPQQERLSERLAQAPSLAPSLRRSLLQMLQKMPTGEWLCHGDFHPMNVILARQGPVIIDWPDATAGRPAADVARTSVLALGEAQRPGTPTANKALLRLFHALYLRRLARLSPAVVAEAEAWRPIMAAARMAEGIEELQEWFARAAA